MGWFSWLGKDKDAIYLNYEKSFDKIIEKTNAILTRRFARRKKLETYSRALWHAVVFSVVAGIGHLVWLNRLPAGTLPLQQHLLRSALSIVIPLGSFIVYSFFGKIAGFFEARDSRMLRRLADSKKKMVQDLKDSTRFEKTMALIRKYSPEDQASLAPMPRPMPPPVTPALKWQQQQQQQQMQQQARNATPPSHLLSAAAGAGKVLLPMFDSFATNVMGDNPQLVAHLRQTQAQLAAEQQRNAALMQQIRELQAKYGISTADMGESLRQLEAPPEPSSPPKELTFNVQATDDDANASPNFLTGPFVQPKTLTYSAGGASRASSTPAGLGIGAEAQEACQEEQQRQQQQQQEQQQQQQQDGAGSVSGRQAGAATSSAQDTQTFHRRGALSETQQQQQQQQHQQQQQQQLQRPQQQGLKLDGLEGGHAGVSGKDRGKASEAAPSGPPSKDTTSNRSKVEDCGAETGSSRSAGGHVQGATEVKESSESPAGVSQGPYKQQPQQQQQQPQQEQQHQEAQKGGRSSSGSKGKAH